MNREFKKACVATTAKAQKKADAILNEEKFKAEQQKNKEILDATIEAKRALIDLRKSLKESLFQGVMAKLAEYIESNEYEQFLINDIKALAQQFGGQMTVYLCPRDMVFERKITETPNVKVLEDKDDMIGGYRAVIANQNMIIDNSYKEKLREANDSFNGFKIV
jgi:vacuolar-type H+-ATPase subunit E/Vma4